VSPNLSFVDDRIKLAFLALSKSKPKIQKCKYGVCLKNDNLSYPHGSVSTSLHS